MSGELTKTTPFWRRLTGSGATYSTSPPPRQTKPLPVDSDADGDESVSPSLWLLASAVWAAYGAQAPEILAAVKDSAWPQPDPQLVDGDGNPVWTSRVRELEPDTLREPLGAVQTMETANAEALADDRLRTLALLCGPLEPLLARAAELTAAVTDEAQRKALQLRITVFLPEHWSDPERALAVRFIDQSANAPETKNRWLVNAAAGRGYESHVPALFDQLAPALQRERRPVLWIVLAADSALSSSRIAMLEAEGHLYKSGHRDSAMAGEGAAGVLIAGARAPEPWTGAPAMRLHWAQGQRDDSADASAQPDTTTLGTLGAAVLQAAQREPTDLCAVVSDADHRKSRAFEILHWAMQVSSEIVAEEKCFPAGTSSGHVGAAVAELYALALAHHLAEQQQRPALAASVGDALTRSVLIVAPAAVATQATS